MEVIRLDITILAKLFRVDIRVINTIAMAMVMFITIPF